MNSNYEIISKEIIKPSSKTPDHLKIFKLSYFDQFAPPVYVSSIFFYEAEESRGLSTTTSNHIQISQNLKKSLSETLTSFYPFAGRVHGSTIDCNDAGVEFIDTQVHSKLTESIHEPDVEHLKNLLPLDPAIVRCQGTLLLVQLNFFDCGGIALGICVSHRIADVSCIMAFVTAWVATHAGERKTSQVGFQLSTLFPAREISRSNTWETLIPDENLGTKMLVFTKEKLAVLRRMVISSTGSTVEDPTRVELVSAFIWQNLSQFFKTHPQKGSFGAFHAVNLRARVGQKHQILENVFGNFVMPAFVFPKSNLNIVAEEYHESVRKFRNAIRSINGDISIDRESQDRVINDVLNLFTNKEIELYLLTSWCRFPFYEVDFGWGKPIWVCTSRGTVKNAIVLLDSKDGEGVETWLSNMDQDFLEILQTQIKLI